MEVLDELGHVAGQERLVRAHGVARELGGAGLGNQGGHVVQDLGAGGLHGHPVLQGGQEARGGVHGAHVVVHLLQRGGGGLDEHIDSLRQGLELIVGDDDGDLDERVGALVQPRHLTVDPHQRVRGSHLLAHGNHCSHLGELQNRGPSHGVVRFEARWATASWHSGPAAQRSR